MYIAGRDWFLLVKNEDKIQFKTKNKLPSITSPAWYNSQAHDMCDVFHLYDYVNRNILIMKYTYIEMYLYRNILI